LKLWFVIRSYGSEGLARLILEHCRLARDFARWVDDHPAFERLAPVPFSTVCFRYRPAHITGETELERINSGILEEVNAGGEVFLSHTKLRGAYVLRMAIGNQATRRSHVARAWELLQEAAARRS
jgi:aromatic-L-amino-acid decarboxylase